MKKKFFAFFVVLLFSVGLTSNVYGAQGNWVSSWQWDANGVSGIGTANAQNETGHFSIRVVRAGGSWIGNKDSVLGPNQSMSADFWGQPLLDRQGQVLISSRYYHTPWFNV